MLAAHKSLLRANGADNPHTTGTGASLAALYEAWGGRPRPRATVLPDCRAAVFGANAGAVSDATVFG